MKWLNWNYVRIGLLAFVQSTLVTMLFHPWLQLSAVHWEFEVDNGVLWIFFTTLVCLGLVKKSVGLGKQGWPFIVSAVIIPLILSLGLGLPVLLFVPLNLVLFVIGLRFSQYPKQARFASDWAVGSLCLVISASFEGVLGFQVTLGPILLFFALGIVAVILWNTTALEEDGLRPDYGGLGRFIALFVLVVGSLSLALGIVFSPAFLQGFMTFVRSMYSAAVNAFSLIIVRPLVWLLSPLFRWVESLETHEITLELSELERSGAEVTQTMTETPLSEGVLETISRVSWFLGLIVLLVVLWIVVRRLLNQPQTKQRKLLNETRESVFSSSQVLGDLKSAFQGIFRPLARLGQVKWYKGDDPRLIIRTIYTRFAVRATKKVTWPQGDSPQEYLSVLQENSQAFTIEATETLTTLYNEARYGELGDQETVNVAEKAFEDI